MLKYQITYYSILKPNYNKTSPNGHSNKQLPPNLSLKLDGLIQLSVSIVGTLKLGYRYIKSCLYSQCSTHTYDYLECEFEKPELRSGKA